MKLISDGGEAALYVDERCGFSQVIPGHPRLLDVASRPGEPLAHAAVEIADLPSLTMRWRLDALPGGMQPGALAASLAQAFGMNRAAGPPRVFSAPPERLVDWGCAGAASSLYPLRQPDGAADTEEVFVLVRPDQASGTWAMVITKRFPSSTAQVRFGAFTVAANAGLRWRPGEPAPAAPAPVWPESSFLEPGVACRLLPERQRAARELAAALTGAADTDLRRAAERIAVLASGGSEPPASPVSQPMRETFAQWFADVSPPPAALRAFTTLLDEALTSRDLRGVALVVLGALTDAARAAAN